MRLGVLVSFLIACSLCAEDALLAKARAPEKILQEFKAQDSNLSGEMNLISEYCAVITQLEKAQPPSLEQRKLLDQYKKPENLKEIIFHTKEILDSYRESDGERRENRKAELKRLSSQAEFLQQKLLETQVKTKPPTAEEARAIEKFLKEFSTHLEAKDYDKLSREYFALPPEAAVENRKDHEEECKTLIRDLYAVPLKKLLASLLEHRDNWFVFTDSKNVKTATLIRIKSDAEALGKDYFVIEIKWLPEGMRCQQGFGYYNSKESGPLRLK